MKDQTSQRSKMSKHEVLKALKDAGINSMDDLADKASAILASEDAEIKTFVVTNHFLGSD